MPSETTSAARATAAARYPAQCVMAPTIPAGHSGSPRAPRRMAAGATPSWASAARAQARAVANSALREGTARATSCSSPGSSGAVSAGSP